MKKTNLSITIKYNPYSMASICLIVLYALFFPALENPDEAAHLLRILEKNTIWGGIVHHIGIFFFDVGSLNFINDLTGKQLFSYVRNQFIFFPVDPPIEYYFLKLINVFFVLTFFFWIVKIFNGNKLVLLWPSATYYMSMLTSEALAYSLMLGSTTYTKKKIFLALFFSLILIFLDRSILIFISFLLMKFFIMTISKNNFITMKKYSIYLVFTSLIIYFMAMINHELFFFTPKLIYDNILYAYSLDPNHLYQIVIFVFSLMMLSGNMSFYPSIFFYAYMSFLLLNIFYNKRNHVELNKHICDIYIGLSTVLIFSALIPQLSHFRFYLFLVPPILALFTVRYSAKHLFLLTFVAFTYNTVGLNIMNHL